MQRDRSISWHLKSTLSRISPSIARSVVSFFFFVLLLGGFISARWINNRLMISTVTTSTTTAATTQNQNLIFPSTFSQTLHPHRKAPISSPHPPPPSPPPALIPFVCPTKNLTATHNCPSPPSLKANFLAPSPSCPDYFRWIHEDLRPWKATGITKEMVNRAQRTANFRLVILDGRVYYERYRRSFQTRDVFTLWGILQLLRRYPGRVPNLELMFDCVDRPVVKAVDYHGKGKPAPPPLFRYCGNDSTLDIVFPDWSFWGWPEINIRPWKELLRKLKEGNKRVKWMNREPYAYWKGNPAVAVTRQELLKCNISKDQDWNARIYAQDWLSETKKGFKQSDLTSQCIHRYKIYIEGSAWSVSEKYILACDSLSLIVSPHYHDFFTRELMPVHHYWPIRDNEKCRSIKFAVDWGNSHKQKAQAIGKEASTFIQEKLSMDYVYDYMFHLLSEYAKLLRYKPTKPPKAFELCSESVACPTKGIQREFMMESMVKVPHSLAPCSMLPPYNPAELRQLQRRKANSIKQVEMWEQRAWESNSN